MTLSTATKGCLFAALLSILQLPLGAQRIPVATDSAEPPTVDGALTDPRRLSFADGSFLFPSLWHPGSVSFSAAAAASDVNSIVHALAWNNGDLYAAGDFSVAGDYVVGYVARWDGSAWIPLGDFPSGLDGPAQALAFDGDKIYVGGNFTQAGPIRTRNVAVWDRSSNTWSDLGGGVGGTLRNGVSAIAVHNGQVYVGGSFIAAGKTVAAYIARWDGRRWHRVGTGVNDAVNALHVDGNYLYAGGDFTIAGDIPARGIARYNLSSGVWENVGVDVDGSVMAVASDSRYLYAGGVFDSVAGQSVNNIIRIEKSSGTWSPLYKGLTGYSYTYGGSSQVKAVESIIVRGDFVYVGGTLLEARVPTSAGERELGLAGVARWDGETWSNLDPTSSPDNPSQRFHGVGKGAPAPANVYALSFYENDTIVVGGDFQVARNYSGQNYASPYICVIDPGGLFRGFAGATGNRQWNNPATGIGPIGHERAFLISHRQSGGVDPHGTLLMPGYGVSRPPSAMAPGSVADDAYWQSVGPNASTDNGVLALASDKDEVYAGGTFVNIFGVEANGIAVRRNKEWFPLDDGTAVGIDGFVFTIVLSGSKVYVGGQFSKAGGVAANNIAVWDRNTRTWSALGGGITGDGTSPAFVSEILVRGNEVYVAGNFTTAGGTEAKSVAHWRNGQWSGLGDGIDGTVNALEFFRGNLYVGGSFSGAGEISSNGVAYWDGNAWKAMRAGVGGTVNDLEVYHSFPGDTLLAIGGEFTIRVDTLLSYYGIRDSRGRVIDVEEVAYTGVDIGRNIVFWNGSDWRLHEANSDEAGSGCYSSAPIRMKDGAIRRLVADGGNLYVAGSFDDAFPRGSGSVSGSLNNVTFYNRTIFSNFVLPLWSPVKGGVNGNVSALTVTGDEILIGGDFTRASNGDMEADHVAIWNKKEQDWIWAGNPTALAPVEALAVHNNVLYASGSFTSQEIGLFDITNQLARLTQSGWRTVEGIVQGTPFVLASASGDELISGGAILTSDRKISVNVARWNSATNQWNPLTPGSGVASLEDISFVRAVAANQTSIYVGGDFDIADTLTARNVAVWNRAAETWHALGEGLNGTVFALALDGDGTLYAGGNFTRSGTTNVKHVARWDGTSWQPLGEGVDGEVYSLAVADGILYVGGGFDTAGGTPALNVARWDIASRTWSPFGSGLTADFEPSVNAISVVNGQIFAAGKFDRSGTDPMSNIARWHPAGWWIPLGSGTDRLVNALAPDPATESLYVGGYFLSAGAKPSRYVGLWTNLTLSLGSDGRMSAGNIMGEGTPNPFTTGATVRLRLPDGERRQVRLELFDPTGRMIRTLADGPLTSGEHTIEIEGGELPAGVYMLRLQSNEIVESVKLVKW